MRDDGLPGLDVLGRDLLVLRGWRRAMSLLTPFLLVLAFFLFAWRGLWIASLACTVLLTFLTYGSISHDLVHGTLGLSRPLNEALLGAIELIALRSGHAYRIVHLHHHARFPAADDLEGAAAGMSWWRALADGLTLQPRLWRFALRSGRDRRWVIAEALAVVAHDPRGGTDLSQTRLFRGRVLSVLALEHLYHLEHHLYPQVPHHNWPALAHRLDPHFARAGLRPVKLLF
jgi:beta-carotene hydroxylase